MKFIFSADNKLLSSAPEKSLSAFSQTRITGVGKDVKGEAISGVSIKLKKPQLERWKIATIVLNNDFHGVFTYYNATQYIGTLR